ncbi:glycoside hydrolase family 99-like domain-containing protein [Asaia krungthepensis]|uniref:Glycosyltransferase 2-like domain-containing protein n=1 Tax=Asaia krungthepensis NRIC 0535 TaxID=1307925 RepID=A0ABQ0PXK4_9PROT|nr:glycoside hydrolase family 99-like domain-containing protein [Asaia krungthepensis]GBQ84041.1 hypothetical protein AA0535_0401 [Asaia krungthepensis NRIC 0535]
MPTIIKMIGHSGLFDTAFYISRNPDLHNIGSGALNHYHHYGWREGRKPNAFFDPAWYLSTYRDVTGDPLLHYLTRGEFEGRRPVPWFDPIWYRQTNQAPANTNALAHYLANRQFAHIRPLPEFDPVFYLAHYPDVAASGMDPVEHYMVQGFREVRRPFAGFDPGFYRQRYLRHEPEANPFLHWLAHRHEAGVFACLPEHETTTAREIRRRTQPGPGFETHHPLPDAARRRARVLAYYLPQFHPTPQNDRWWGKGFTEWTNLARGVPRFADHYQPRTPRDLGHYRLDDPSTLRAQALMARQSGIEGFIFYHYWFDGERLLDTPMEILLADQSIALPFCLMWANENWSRRWDGGDTDLLITQTYREDDDAALIADFARHMRDPRYITVGERPLFMIYRPGTIPDARRRLAAWRHAFETSHGLKPLMIMAQAFDDDDPAPFGMDGVIEFPPHKLTRRCTPIEGDLQILDQDMTARVYDYAELVDQALLDPAPSFPRIRTVTPSWDNDARRQGAGLVLHGSTPRLYERWLKGVIDQACEDDFHGERLVCVNAWNEWAEGAYLEPDVHFGAAYLNATARAVTGFQSRLTPHRLLLVGHDAFPAGAQRLLLSIGRSLRRNHGIDVAFVLLGGGELLGAYREIGNVDILSPGTRACQERLKSLHAEGFSHALVNSAVSGVLAPDLASAGLTYILLIHELQGMIAQRNLEHALPVAVDLACHVIVPGAQLTRLFPKAHILPQGLYNAVHYSGSERIRLRQAYGIEPEALVVAGVGYADMRKGFDLFLQLWQMTRSPAFRQTLDKKPDRPVHFLWVGRIEESLRVTFDADLKAATSTGTFHLCGEVENVGAYLSCADLFTLTSREDPYPSVVLEALTTGLSCMAFARAGMIPDLLAELRHEGDRRHAIIPPGDLTDAAAWVLANAVKGPEPDAERDRHGTPLAARFSFDTYVRKLLPLAMPELPTISVVVLSCNYRHYLEARLATIFAQDCPVIEIIVIDDGSSDGSADFAELTARSFDQSIRVLRQEIQSGSVFGQWRKAADIAQGDWLWIAEADDLAEPDFLGRMSQIVMQTPGVTMAFCDSRAIDRDGVQLWPSYKDYYRSHGVQDLERDCLMDGESFVESYLSSANMIMNVSAALFRRSTLRDAFDRCAEELAALSLAGDWRVYVELLLHPGSLIAYVAEPLNIHRRHRGSVTGGLDPVRHLQQITVMHDLIAARLHRDHDLLSRQKTYRLSLKAQFGLKTPEKKRRARLS